MLVIPTSKQVTSMVPQCRCSCHSRGSRIVTTLTTSNSTPNPPTIWRTVSGSPHKETDVGEEEAHGHVVDAGRELPAQDARDPRQPYCDEHRRRGPRVVPAQPSVLPPPTPALYHVPNPRSVSGSFASTHQFIHGAKVANRTVRGTEIHRERSTAGPTTGSAAKRPAEGWR